MQSFLQNAADQLLGGKRNRDKQSPHLYRDSSQSMLIGPDPKDLPRFKKKNTPSHPIYPSYLYATGAGSSTAAAYPYPAVYGGQAAAPISRHFSQPLHPRTRAEVSTDKQSDMMKLISVPTGPAGTSSVPLVSTRNPQANPPSLSMVSRNPSVMGNWPQHVNGNIAITPTIPLHGAPDEPVTEPMVTRNIGKLSLFYFGDLGSYAGRGGSILLFIRGARVAHEYYELRYASNWLGLKEKLQAGDKGCLGITGVSRVYNPQGTLPIILHKEMVLSETTAIMRYLAKALDFYGSDPLIDYLNDMMMDKVEYWRDELMVYIQLQVLSSPGGNKEHEDKAVNVDPNENQVSNDGRPQQMTQSTAPNDPSPSNETEDQTDEAVLKYIELRRNHYSLFDKILQQTKSLRGVAQPNYFWSDYALFSCLYDDIQLVRRAVCQDQESAPWNLIYEYQNLAALYEEKKSDGQINKWISEKTEQYYATAEGLHENDDAENGISIGEHVPRSSENMNGYNAAPPYTAYPYIQRYHGDALIEGHCPYQDGPVYFPYMHYERPEHMFEQYSVHGIPQSAIPQLNATQHHVAQQANPGWYPLMYAGPHQTDKKYNQPPPVYQKQKLDDEDPVPRHYTTMGYNTEPTTYNDGMMRTWTDTAVRQGIPAVRHQDDFIQAPMHPTPQGCEERSIAPNDQNQWRGAMIGSFSPPTMCYPVHRADFDDNYGEVRRSATTQGVSGSNRVRRPSLVAQHSANANVAGCEQMRATDWLSRPPPTPHCDVTSASNIIGGTYGGAPVSNMAFRVNSQQQEILLKKRP